MNASIKLGRIFGIPFGLHYTWFFVFVLVTFLLAVNLFPDLYPGWTVAQFWLVALVTSLLFFASIVAHELGHSLVAIRHDIRVESITLFVFGGVAKIAKEPSKPRVEALIAIAGPIVSFGLGALFVGLYLVTKDSMEPISGAALYLGRINFVVAVFNLIPGFPLDGGRVFRAIIWAIGGNYMRATKISSFFGRSIGYLLIAVGVFFVVWKRDVSSGLWIAFIGWFLENAAAQSYRQLKHSPLRQNSSDDDPGVSGKR